MTGVRPIAPSLLQAIYAAEHEHEGLPSLRSGLYAFALIIGAILGVAGISPLAGVL